VDPGSNEQNHEMVMTSVSGHLMNQEFNGDFKNWNAVNPSILFDADVRLLVPEANKNIEKTLLRESAGAQVLIIWTDCDREGEAIGEEIAVTCRSRKPNIIVKRARFSVANDANVWQAVRNLVNLDMNQVAAVQARGEIDLRLGAVFTRFQTLRLGGRFPQLEGRMISFGPCQIPTLGLVVERFEKIESFIREPFWTIQMEWSNEETREKCAFLWHRQRLFDHLSCLALFESCVQEQVAQVLQVTQKPKSKWRPLPLATVQLQIRMSKFCRMSSEVTMKIAEGLYQRGLISYPRTETDSFAASFDLPSMVQLQRNHSTWGLYTSSLMDGNGFRMPRAGNHNDEAHPPIHPTSTVELGALQNDDERKLYEFVVRHFLACCSQDAEGAESSITVGFADEKFTVTGIQILEKNYLEIYIYERWAERTLPVMKQGDLFVPSLLQMKESSTEPPRLLTEVDLIGLMDRHGIGTDATIQDHIKTIVDREYAVKSIQQVPHFSPTVLGRSLIAAYKRIGHEKTISKPYTRALMEASFTAISMGTKTKNQVVQDTIAIFKVVYQDTIQHVEDMFGALDHYFNQDNGDNHNGGGEGGGGEGGGDGLLVVNTNPLFKYDLKHRKFSLCGTCNEKSLDLRNKTFPGPPGPRGGASTVIRTCLTCDLCHAAFKIPPGKPQVLNDVICPLCNFQVVNIIKTESSSYTICPYCYNRPPAKEGEIIEIEGIGSMPCFKCCNASCSLSRGVDDAPVSKCICSKGHLTLKKTKASKYMIGCDAYPSCKETIVLPDGIQSVTLANSCSRCHFRKLNVLFKSGSIPMGNSLKQIVCPNPKCNALSGDIREIMQSCLVRRAVNVNYSQFENQSANVNRSQFTNQPVNVNRSQFSNQTFNSYQSQFSNQPVNTNQSQFENQSVNANPMVQRQNSHQSENQYINHHSNSSVVPNVCPTHSTECSVLTVFKDGVNKGRRFFKCKTRECTYFKWSDELTGAQHRPQNSNESYSTSSAAKCFKCNQPGHFANNCPGDNSRIKSDSTQQKKTKSSLTQQKKTAKRSCNDCGSELPFRKRICPHCKK